MDSTYEQVNLFQTISLFATLTTFLFIMYPHRNLIKWLDNSYAIFASQNRRLSIHMIETFIPTATMVVVSWFSFLIPPESFPGRVAVLVTLLLVLINCMLKILDYSPVVGSCALSEWTLICLCMVRNYYRKMFWI